MACIYSTNQILIITHERNTQHIVHNRLLKWNTLAFICRNLPPLRALLLEVELLTFELCFSLRSSTE